MSRAVKGGSADFSTVIRIVDSTDGTPEQSVTSATAGLALWYRREAGTLVALTESDLATLDAAHSDGGMLHIDDGFYRVDLPDAAVAAGAGGVLVGGAATGMVVIGAYHAIDEPVDAVAISGDQTAADNLEAACDGGSYNVGGGAVVAASVTGAVGSVTGAVGSVTGAVASVTAGVTLANGAHGGAAASLNLASGLTANVTGNLSGSVGSVTGAVGSVTGAVGSVTGAVGSVTGAVGSVTGAVGSVTGNVGGNVTGSVGSVVGHTVQTGDSYALANGASGFVAIKGDTAATLLDTGTDGVVVAAASKTGYALSAAGVQAIWDALTSALTTVGSIGKKLADWTIGTTQTGDSFARLGAPAGASVSADIAAIPTNPYTGTPPTAGAIADQVWEEAIADHSGTAGSTAASLNAASAPTAAAVADAVWDEASTGHTDAGKAGAQLWTDVDAILADTGTDGVVLSTAQMQSLADVLLARSVSTIEATAAEHSLATLILAALESSISGTTWTIKRTDGSTTHATKTVTTDAAADPITGVS